MDGNILIQMQQDNTNYQKIVSFTFDKGIASVYDIQIVDENKNQVYLLNGLYVITEEQTRFLID